jgi:pimeloyl-ACP methyl ester carboxylesterase
MSPDDVISDARLMPRAKPPIVLVHGAFHGGWCWAPVARLLRARGYQVFTPTQTGLGDRRHLIAAATGMDVFVNDILEVLLSEELEDVVLVGHSYGARSISGVADRAPELIRRLVYIDGGLPMGSLSRLDSMPQAEREARIQAAIDFDGGISVPPPSAARFGIADSDLASWLERHLTPQPLAVERSVVELSRPIGAGRPVTFVRCIEPPFEGTEASAAFARERADWRYVEISAGHNVMVTHPEETANLILAEAALEP